jgi:antirestriction protein ArdC
MAPQIKRDLYAEVTSRILAELERGAAPWVKPWSATPGQNVPRAAPSKHRAKHVRQSETLDATELIRRRGMVAHCGRR